eukprot:7380293-Prymnesium_polylepis.2
MLWGVGTRQACLSGRGGRAYRDGKTVGAATPTFPRCGALCASSRIPPRHTIPEPYVRKTPLGAPTYQRRPAW